MSRKFRTPDYESALNQAITLREALPPNHLVRFVVMVIGQLDLSHIYARYAHVGGEAIAPEILLGLLFYGYATGVFSSRKLEKATGKKALSINTFVSHNSSRNYYISTKLIVLSSIGKAKAILNTNMTIIVKFPKCGF